MTQITATTIRKSESQGAPVDSRLAAISQVLRAAFAVLWSPQIVMGRLKVSIAVGVLALCFLSEFASGYVAFLATERHADFAVALSRQADFYARVRLSDQLPITAVLVFFWWGIGLLVSRRSRDPRAIFAVIATATVVSSLAYVLRALVYAYSGDYPEPFTLGRLDQMLGVGLLKPGFVDLFRVWWSVLAGLGFAQIWNRSPTFTAVATVAVTELWIRFGHRVHEGLGGWLS